MERESKESLVQWGMGRAQKKFITNAIKELQKKKIIKTVEKLNHYYDEPKIHYFTAHKYSDKYEPSTGLSFDSPELAQLRCTGEAIERNVLLDISKQKFKSATYAELKKENALNPNLLNENLEDVSCTPFLWTRGYEGIDTTLPVWIPAQTVFLNTSVRKNEPFLLPAITTGAAGGFDHESTLLRAIYEVIERDSFMSIYLTKSVPKKIDLKTIPYKKIQDIISYLRRYALEPHLFDITTDIGIPVFMVILLDRTGIGPYFTISAKAGVDTSETIQGALEESLLTRHWIRKLKRTFLEKKYSVPNRIHTMSDRAQYWLPKTLLRKLSYLIEQTEVKLNLEQYHLKRSISELDSTKNRLLKMGYQIYFCDASNSLCKTLNYKIYKVIVPGLQPLYINEQNKIYNPCRLLHVANFFGKKKYTINIVPHPFL